MPYTIHREPQGVYVRYVGHITAAEMIKSVEEVTADPNFIHFRYRINDFLAVTGYTFQPSDMEYVAAISYGGAQSHVVAGFTGLIAQVATDERQIAILKQYTAMKLAPYIFNIVPDVQQARAWIAGQLRLQAVHSG